MMTLAEIAMREIERAKSKAREELRDQFAIAALPAVMASGDIAMANHLSMPDDAFIEHCAIRAYMFADAMLKERDKIANTTTQNHDK